MKIKIYRLEWTDKGVFGHLVVDNFTFDCVTLERHDTLIPTGTFKATLYDSPSLKRKVLLLHDVPGRSFVEMHPADVEGQLKGCIAVASRRNNIMNMGADGFAADNNKATFDKLLSVVNGAEEIWLTVS